MYLLRTRLFIILQHIIFSSNSVSLSFHVCSITGCASVVVYKYGRHFQSSLIITRQHHHVLHENGIKVNVNNLSLYPNVLVNFFPLFIIEDFLRMFQPGSKRNVRSRTGFGKGAVEAGNLVRMWVIIIIASVMEGSRKQGNSTTFHPSSFKSKTYGPKQKEKHVEKKNLVSKFSTFYCHSEKKQKGTRIHLTTIAFELGLSIRGNQFG